MSPRERPQVRGPRGHPHSRPPDPGPPLVLSTARRPRCQPQPHARKARPKKIVFEDELPSLHTTMPRDDAPKKPALRPPPVPDYELKYPPVSSTRARSRYAAVFRDQYPEFLELQQEVDQAQAKLQQLEALLSSLPAPRSQKEAQVSARLRRDLEKKRMDPSFLDKQARCRYLKGKLRHLKMQIRKFDEQDHSEDSVFF